MYRAIIAAVGGHAKYWNEIKYDVIWFCSFCFKGVHVNLSVKFLLEMEFQWFLFYMLGINCIKLIFGYLYFLRILFLKYDKKN